MLLSVVLKVNIKCDFRTSVQETNLNYSSKPSIATGYQSSGSVLTQLQGWWLGQGKWGQVSGAELTAAGSTARQSWDASLSPPGLPYPQPHAGVFVWTHPSVFGGLTPSNSPGKGQVICWGYLFYCLLWYHCLMIFTCWLFLSYLLSFLFSYRRRT